MDKPKSNNIGTSLVDSVLSAGAADIASDMAELALDSALDVGLFKDVPVFGWLFKAYGVVTTIRERIFLSKVANFLQATSAVSDRDREKFLEKLTVDPEFSRKIGENLILLLDRHDNMDKAQILGKVFSGYLCGEIDYDAFLKIAAAIDQAFIADLKNLNKYYEKLQSYDSKAGKPFAEYLDDDTAQSLYNAGLVRREGYIEDTYHPNEIGSQLIRLKAE
jgi:hypothetical protein